MKTTEIYRSLCATICYLGHFMKIRLKSFSLRALVKIKLESMVWLMCFIVKNIISTSKSFFTFISTESWWVWIQTSLYVVSSFSFVAIVKCKLILLNLLRLLHACLARISNASPCSKFFIILSLLHLNKIDFTSKTIHLCIPLLKIWILNIYPKVWYLCQ